MQALKKKKKTTTTALVWQTNLSSMTVATIFFSKAVNDPRDSITSNDF